MDSDGGSQWVADHYIEAQLVVDHLGWASIKLK